MYLTTTIVINQGKKKVAPFYSLSEIDERERVLVQPVTCERQTKASSMLFLQSNSYNDRCITAYKLRHRKTESTHWSKILTNIVYPRVNSFTDSANFLTGWFRVRRSHISGVKITEIRYSIQLSCRVARNLNLSNFQDNGDSKFANILNFQSLFTY